ncbi:MAG: tetratricopeptide repeat protein [Gemmatimonadales bacterium]|nr:MAG: tetratricopeptide repeat protein [Gemmatimonadales bacterium]
MRFPRRAIRAFLAGVLLLGAPVHGHGLPEAEATPTRVQSRSPLEEARTHFHAGRYEDALDVLRPLTRRGRGDPAARKLHARVLQEQGAYREGLEILGGDATPPELARIRGELLLEMGRLDDAEAAFQLSAESGAPDAAVARLHLGEMAFMRGDRDEAMAVFDSFIDLYNRSSSLDGETTMAVARAVTYLGRRSPALFQDALKAYDEAAEQLTGDPRPLVAVGDLFLSKYASPDAYDEYRRVLDVNPHHPDALLGRARAQEFDGSPEAIATARQALETNPNHVGARILVARIHLRAEAVEAALEEIRTALEVNPASLEALAVLAAAQHLAGDAAGFAATLRRSDGLNPDYPGLYSTLAQVSADTRKYQDAVRFAREAVRRDPRAWDALGILATNQLRTGALSEGRRNMETAFSGDPYNPWFKNTLDLLDTWANYRTVETEHFRIMLHEREAELLEPYVTHLAEEAFAALAERYGTEPPTPIRLEIYPSSADFSVRTLGMVGLGALGVSFGSTLVMDSPSARNAGEFNWESTLWHELAHAFHLGISEHNVPRWFSEGLAVREQRVARDRWGFPVSPVYLQAWHDGMMPPLSRMNEAFVRPQFPQQVVFAYTQASLAFDWIEEDYGFQAIRGFLDGYRTGRDTQALAREILGLDDDELDDAFDAYLRERFRTELAAVVDIPSPLSATLEDRGNDAEVAVPGVPVLRDLETMRARVRAQPGAFQPRLELGQALVAAGEMDEAEEHLREALRLFPRYPDPNGPLRQLARIHEQRGEIRQASDALRRLGSLNENVYEVYRDEARLRRLLEDVAGERAALLKAVEVFPYDPDLHARLAELHRAVGDTDGLVRERRAVLSLDPVDRAEAHFRLAQALVANGDAREGRRQLLRALEIAPTYEPALELLLELRGGGS